MVWLAENGEGRCCGMMPGWDSEISCCGGRLVSEAVGRGCGGCRRATLRDDDKVVMLRGDFGM